MLICRRIVNCSNSKVSLKFRMFQLHTYILMNLTHVWRRVNVRDNVILPNCILYHYHSLLKKQKTKKKKTIVCNVFILYVLIMLYMYVQP